MWSKMPKTDYDLKVMAHIIEPTVSVEIKPAKPACLLINKQYMMILLKYTATLKYSNENTVTT